MLKTMLKTMEMEWNRMVKYKMIFIIILLIPILVNLLLGIEFSGNQIQNIPMVIYDQDHSSLSRMIAQQFSENEIFDVKYRVDDSEAMKKLLDHSKARVGMVIPKDFSKDVTALKSPTILMVYDGSHMSIAAAAKGRATEILLTLKTGILIKFMEGKMNLPEDVAQKMALSIKFSNRTLYNPAKSFKNFLNPGFGTAIVQSGIALMAAVAVKRDEIEKGKLKRIGYLIGKILFYTLLGSIGLVISIVIQAKVFQIPFRGQFGEAVLLSIFLAMAVSSFGIMVSSWVPDEMLSTQINAVVFIPNTIMVGYTWPVLSMPKIYQNIANYYPFYHYADNLRDLFLKGTSIKVMVEDIAWFSVFILITAFIGLIGILRLKAEGAGVNGKEGEELVLSK